MDNLQQIFMEIEILKIRSPVNNPSELFEKRTEFLEAILKMPDRRAHSFKRVTTRNCFYGMPPILALETFMRVCDSSSD